MTAKDKTVERIIGRHGADVAQASSIDTVRQADTKARHDLYELISSKAEKMHPCSEAYECNLAIPLEALRELFGEGEV